MTDLLVVAGLGAAAFYLMQKPVINPSESSVVAQSEDHGDTDGYVMPQGNLGDQTSQTSLAMQQDMENPEITNDTVASQDAFVAFMATQQGQVEFLRWRKKDGRHMDKNAALKAFESHWRIKHHDPKELGRKLKNVHKRTMLYAAVQSTNLFDPDRLTQVRQRPTTAPRVAEFATNNTRITGTHNYLEHSPYTVKNFDAIPECPWASSRDGIRTDTDSLIDYTQLVATAAPTKMLGQQGGAVRMNFDDMHSRARALRHRARSEPTDPEWQPTAGGLHKQAGRFKRVV